MFPGLHPNAMMSTAGMNFSYQANANGPAPRPPPAGTNQNYHQQHFNGVGPNAPGIAAVGVKPAGPPFGLAHHGGVLGNPPMVAGALAAAQCQVSVEKVH